jgi:hypothetical protein
MKSNRYNLHKKIHCRTLLKIYVHTHTHTHIPILIEVTRRPQALRRTPILLAVTPLPSPLTTPPVTNTYFIVNALSDKKNRAL